MRAKTTAAFLAATAAVVLGAVPVGAPAAKPHRHSQPASISVSLKARGTHGFRLQLLTSNGGSPFLLASRRLDTSSVIYIPYERPPRKTFDGDRLDAKVGNLGHFRGHFVTTSEEEGELPPICDGKRPTIEKGFFVGSFDFHGERGYTVLHAHRLRGEVTLTPRIECTDPPGSWFASPQRENERRRHEFHLIAADGTAGVLFGARREEATRDEPAQTTFEASVSGRTEGNLYVSHSVDEFGFESELGTTFRVPDLAAPPTEATVTPAAPFSGSATFQLDDPRSASWTGDLAVELPGLGKVPLTGEGIDAGLCKGTSCTKTLPKKLQPILEAPNGTAVIIGESKPKGDR